MVDEFMDTHTNVVASGFTNVFSTRAYQRYYSSGEILSFPYALENNQDANVSKIHRFLTKAWTYPGDSGGPIYYENDYLGHSEKIVIGIHSSGNSSITNLYSTSINTVDCRITPTLLHFYLNNSYMV